MNFRKKPITVATNPANAEQTKWHGILSCIKFLPNTNYLA